MQENDNRKDGSAESRTAGLRRMFRAWLELTADEQKAVIVVLVLALLGIGAKIWHIS